MIDFHSHLVPAVDDGAADLDQARAALATMQAQGLRVLIVTPHLQASVTARPEPLRARLAELDAGWSRLRALAAAEFPDLRVERGAEVMLDIPAPDLSDARVRLAGTRFALVEFPSMTVPPNSGNAVRELCARGWIPIVAHPERYAGMDAELAVVGEWRRGGAHLQVNCGSLLGRYGSTAKAAAWRLLRRGWVDYLGSDYHARGACLVEDARARLVEAGGEEQARLLMEVNPARLLHDELPAPVPPLDRRRVFWRRFLG